VYFTRATLTESFIQKLRLAPEMVTGEHIVTLSAAASKKYAPVTASAVFRVIKLIPTMEMDTPWVALIPGSFTLKGKIHSKLSEVNDAVVRIGFNGSQAEVASSDKGTFETSVKMGMGFGIIGSQDLDVTVTPQEPWHAPLATKYKVVVVNLINCGAILGILVFLGVYLPNRLKKKLGVYSKPKAVTEMPPALSETAPSNIAEANPVGPVFEKNDVDEEPWLGILKWYRLALTLVQKITGSLLKPEQTLREFSQSVSQFLGPAGKYFLELTGLAEKMLYSPVAGTRQDVETGGYLFREIGAGRGTDGQPTIAVMDKPSEAHERNEDGYNKKLTAKPDDSYYNWLWITLVLAVMCFALLLFLLVIQMASRTGYTANIALFWRMV
ncbi:hypothetical protein D4R49_01370, partial [bacterium]